MSAHAISISGRSNPVHRVLGFSVGAAGLLVVTRAALWVGVQLLIAAGLIAGGMAADLAEGLNDAAGW